MLSWTVYMSFLLWNLSDPKGTFSFYAFIMNNKVLLYLYLKWTITLTTDADRTESHPMKWIICLTADTDRTEPHPMEWIICLTADTDQTEPHPMEWIICLTADTDRTEPHPKEWIICLTADTDRTESHPMEWIICLTTDTDQTESHPMEWSFVLRLTLTNIHCAVEHCAKEEWRTSTKTHLHVDDNAVNLKADIKGNTTAGQNKLIKRNWAPKTTRTKN